MLDERTHDDLPRRTWRPWWRQTPSWFRIGVWGFTALAGLHLALAVRIAIGLIEPPEVTWLRERNVSVHYTATHTLLPFDILNDSAVIDLIKEGLVGRSCSQVDYIGPANGTDEHLRYIGVHFPRVYQLYLSHAEITAEGLVALLPCRKLGCLALERSSVNDDDIAQLAKFTSLDILDLSGTLVTDAAIPLLQQMKSLTLIDVSHTRMSLPAIQAWRTSLPVGSPLIIETEKDSLPNTLFSLIRWSDGQCSASYDCGIPFTLTMAGPKTIESWPCDDLDGGQFTCELPSLESFSSNYYWNRWTASRLLQEGDGEYRFVLNIGGQDSEPVVIQVQDGMASTHDLEFRMPIQKLPAWGQNP